MTIGSVKNKQLQFDFICKHF